MVLFDDSFAVSRFNAAISALEGPPRRNGRIYDHPSGFRVCVVRANRAPHHLKSTEAITF